LLDEKVEKLRGIEKMTKNEFKKIAKTAKRIVSEEKYTGYSGSTSQAETEVTYEQMIEELSHCSRWYVTSGTVDAILASSNIASFTVYL